MKLTAIAAITSALFASSAFAATVIGVNSGTFTGSLTEGTVVTDNSGAPVAANSTFAQIATYGGGGFSVGQSVGDVIGDFTFTGSALGIANGFGFLNVSFSDVDEGNSLAGQPVFVVIGNNSDLTMATEIAVYDAGYSFPTQVGGNATGATVPVRTDMSLLFGATQTVSGVGAPFDGANGELGIGISATNLIGIPEPSGLVLLSLGAVGFALRRRR